MASRCIPAESTCRSMPSGGCKRHVVSSSFDVAQIFPYPTVAVSRHWHLAVAPMCLRSSIRSKYKFPGLPQPLLLRPSLCSTSPNNTTISTLPLNNLHNDIFMNCTRTFANTTLLTRQSAAQLLKSITCSGGPAGVITPGLVAIQQQQSHAVQRSFSTSPPAKMKMKEFFPVEETKNIRYTNPAWAHPVYTKEQMDLVKVSHRDTRNLSDRAALFAVRFLRGSLDWIMGYSHGKKITERQFMIRNIFLESVAGVPGICAGMLRHLRSMRLMKRDNGWMETLLEESYNGTCC